MAENAVLLLAYNRIQNMIRDARNLEKEAVLSIEDLCIAGGISGAVVSFVLTPIELLKVRLQLQGYPREGRTSKVKFSGPMSLMIHTLRTKGNIALCKGHALL